MEEHNSGSHSLNQAVLPENILVFVHNFYEYVV
jgi:hypothetical protein